MQPTESADYNTRRTLTVEEAAQLLGVGRAVAYAGVHDGSIPSLRIGRRIVVPRAKLLALLGEEEQE